MSEIEAIKNKIEELEIERKRLLRGFGGRYSRTHRLRTNPDENKLKIKATNKRIKDKKNRIIEISDEINDLKRELEKLELNSMRSSEMFDSAYSESLKLFK